MRILYLVLITLVFGSVRSQGTEVLWISLKTSFAYRDLATVCSNKDFPNTLYFAAEVVGVEVQKATFRNSLASSASIFALSMEEIKGLTLYQDGDGQLWLKSVSMNNRLLNWMLFEAGAGGFSSCKPSQALDSIDPNSFLFEFEVSKTSTEAGSNLGKFRGKLKDGSAYQAQLEFSEKPYQYYVVRESRPPATDSGYAYPQPPWTKSSSVSGNGPNQFSAQSLCRSDAGTKGRRLESTCRSNGGKPSTNHPSCLLCNQLGSQWRCTDTVRVRCSSSSSTDDGREIPDSIDEDTFSFLDLEVSQFYPGFTLQHHSF